MASAALVTFSIFGVVLCLLWAWRKLRFYARTETPAGYLALVGAVWWLGVTAVGVLMPFDVATSSASQASGSGNNSVILKVWTVNYWVTFVCCWVICPLAMEYSASGAFSRKERMKAAVLSNLKFYFFALIGLALIAFLTLMRQGFQISKVSGFFIAAANTYGMFLVVVMLGYGLVELPRELWSQRSPKKLLEWHYCNAPQVEERLLFAQADLEDVLDAVEQFDPSRSDLIVQAHYQDVKVKAQVARDTCFEERSVGSSRVRYGRNASVDGNDGDGSLKHLAALHYRLKKAIVDAQRAKCEFEELLIRSGELEEHVRMFDRGSGSQAYQRLDGGESGLPDSEIQDVSGGPPKRVRFYYEGLRVLAVVTTILSAILLWNECASAWSGKFSVFAILVHNASGEFWRWFFCVVPITYLSGCVYVALFKFKLLDVLALHGNKQTDVYNLLFNASYMGRLQFSLGINYVNQLHPQDRKHLAFLSLIGDMNVVPFLGTSFNTYLPVLILLLAACTFFRLFDRLLNLLGIETHSDPGGGTICKSEMEQGKQLLHRHRARLERRAARAQVQTSRVLGIN